MAIQYRDDAIICVEQAIDLYKRSTLGFEHNPRAWVLQGR